MDATADAMASHGLAVHFTFTETQWFWIVGHWHAEMLARQGWTRPRMQQYVWERAWRTRAALKRLRALRGAIGPGDETERLLAAPRSEDIFIVKAATARTLSAGLCPGAAAPGPAREASGCAASPASSRGSVHGRRRLRRRRQLWPKRGFPGIHAPLSDFRSGRTLWMFGLADTFI